MHHLSWGQALRLGYQVGGEGALDEVHDEIDTPAGAAERLMHVNDVAVAQELQEADLTHGEAHHLATARGVGDALRSTSEEAYLAYVQAHASGSSEARGQEQEI